MLLVEENPSTAGLLLLSTMVVGVLVVMLLIAGSNETEVIQSTDATSVSFFITTGILYDSADSITFSFLPSISAVISLVEEPIIESTALLYSSTRAVLRALDISASLFCSDIITNGLLVLFIGVIVSPFLTNFTVSDTLLFFLKRVDIVIIVPSGIDLILSSIPS